MSNLEIRVIKNDEEYMVELLVVHDNREEEIEIRFTSPDKIGEVVQELFSYTDNFTKRGI